MSGLWRTKSVEQSIQDTDEPGHKLKRTLSAWDLTIFGVAVVIGAGIFTLTARVAATTATPKMVRSHADNVRLSLCPGSSVS